MHNFYRFLRQLTLYLSLNPHLKPSGNRFLKNRSNIVPASCNGFLEIINICLWDFLLHFVNTYSFLEVVTPRFTRSFLSLKLKTRYLNVAQSRCGITSSASISALALLCWLNSPCCAGWTILDNYTWWVLLEGNEKLISKRNSKMEANEVKCERWAVFGRWSPFNIQLIPG